LSEAKGMVIKMKKEKFLVFLLILIIVLFLMPGCNFEPSQVDYSDSNGSQSKDEDVKIDENYNEYDYTVMVKYLEEYKEYFIESMEIIDMEGWTKTIIEELCSKAAIFDSNLKEVDDEDVSSMYKTFHKNYLRHFNNISKMGSYFYEDQSIQGINYLTEAISNIEDAYESIGEYLEIGEITINIRDSEVVAEELAEKEAEEEEVAEEQSPEEVEEATEEEPPQTPQGPSKRTYLNNIYNIINEYNMAINHWNTYEKDYNDLDSYVAFDKTFLNKIGEINSTLKSITPASGYENAQAHFIDLANNMYSYVQQEVNYLEDGNFDAANIMVDNFNNIFKEFKNYYNSL